MADIDTVLSESFRRVAEPGDPTGVAELLRSRVAAGDTGTPSVDGAGFDVGSGWTWLPWIGGGVVVAIVGAVVGASGVFGALQPADSAPAPGFGVSRVAAGLDCPAGARVVSFVPGDRVFAVARSEDSAYLAVRSPYDRSDTVWVALGDLELDPGQPEVASLEVDGCPVPVVTVTPTPEPEPEPAPDKPQPPKPPQPPAPVDNPPTLGIVSISDNTLYQGDSTTISTTAFDDHGVSAVQISWSGADSGSGQMTKVGGQWKFDYTRTANDDGTITFTVRAVDTKNQKSAPKSVNATVYFFG